MEKPQPASSVRERAAEYQLRSAEDESIVRNPPPFRVDKNTLVPIGLVVAMILGCTAGAWKISNALNAVQNKIAEISMQSDKRLEKIEAKLSDGWTTSDMVIWREAVMNDNPSLKMPTIGEIRRATTSGGK